MGLCSPAKFIFSIILIRPLTAQSGVEVVGSEETRAERSPGMKTLVVQSSPVLLHIYKVFFYLRTNTLVVSSIFKMKAVPCGLAPIRDSVEDTEVLQHQ